MNPDKPLICSAIGRWKVVGSGAPERSRTPNPQIRSLVLYPVELRALMPGRGQLVRRRGRQHLRHPFPQGKLHTGTVHRGGGLTIAADRLRWGLTGGFAREKLRDGRYGDTHCAAGGHSRS
jgi:hypothetical protein